MNWADLTVFQYVLLVTISVLLLTSIWALVRGWTGRKEGLVWVAVWLAAGVAILWPAVTSWLARAIGIGRGADLVLYCAVFVMMAGFWTIYIRLRRVRRDITLLVRHLALQEGQKQAGDRADSASSPEDPPQSADADEPA